MALYNNILERVKFIAGGNADKRSKPPIGYVNNDRAVSAVQSGNELSASAVGTTFSCLQLRANGLISVEMKAFKELNWDKQELSNSHWVNRLLSNPNPFFTYSQIFKSLSTWYDVNGNCFLWTPRLGYDYPLQIWVLNPTRMRVIKGGDNFIQGYVYQSLNEGAIAIPEDEVIHFANTFPSVKKPDEIVGMNLFGKSIVSAALPYASIDQEVSNYLVRLFENNATPPLVVKSEDNVDLDVWNNLKQRWNEVLPNYELKALLSGGLDLALPPETEVTTSYDAVSKDVRAQISQVFGVPSGLLTGEFQNRATAEVQYAMFRQQTIDPVAKYFAEEFTRHFRRFEDGVLLEAMPYEFIDTEQQIKHEEFELKYGIKTVNDSRKERGYDAIPSGDVPMVTSGLVPLDTVASMSTTVSAAPKALEAVKKGIVLKAFPLQTAEGRAESWREYDALAQGISKTIEKAIATVITDIKKEAMGQVDAEQPELTMELTEKQQKEIAKTLDIAAEQVTQKILKEFEIGKEDLTGTFGQEMQEMTKKLNANISDSLELIKYDVIETISENASQPKEVLQEILEREFAGLSKNRAAMIAQTTATSVTTGVQKNVYKRAGVNSMWNTQRDKNVRASHSALDGKLQDANGNFMFSDGTFIDRPAGESQMGTTVKAANIVRCRCYLFPVRNK
ncbi:MAG: phage portal protein [Methylophilaceae bacterium]